MPRTNSKDNKITNIKAAGKTDNKLGMGAVIKKYRLASGIGTNDLARMLDVTRGTILHWESDINRPSVEQIKDLCELMGIPLDELFGVESKEPKLSQNESHLVNWYRELSDIGKHILYKMAMTMNGEEQDARDQRLKNSYRLIPLEVTPAAAGPGCEFSDAERGYKFVKINDVSKKADALIRVSGRSMEPRYRDGDYVYVKYTTDAADGDDVVCSSVDGAVIKHKVGNKLYSVNPDLPYGEKSEDDNVRIEGVVISIVHEDELANKKDSDDLDELLFDQVRDFKKLF